MLETELDVELGCFKRYKKNKYTDNRQNSYSTKTIKTQFGEIPLEVWKNKNWEFKLVIVLNNKRDISGIEEQVISLYKRWMVTRGIHDQLKDIYGIQLSA